MFSQHLERILTQISATDITEIFIYAIGIIFILAILFSLLRWFQRFTQYAPTLMTSLGILGTFVGIVIGLLGFDTSNIDGSIPELLDGLKTAFITSICGLIGAICFNFIDSLFLQAISSHKKQMQVEEEVTPTHIYQALQSQTQTMMQMGEGIEAVHQGLTGQEEGSLIGQFKLMRADLITMTRSNEMLPKQLEQLMILIENAVEVSTEERKSLTEEVSSLRVECSAIRQQNVLLTDFIAQFTHFTQTFAEQHQTFSATLFQKLEDFAEMLSKSATEQIIEALKNVIEEFNHNLMDQFGENFKALDHSVGQLVTWQAQYREQVEVMGEQYAQSVASLVETKEAVGGIWQACENIPVAMEQLKEVMIVNQHQIEELQRHLESFVAMRDAAVEAVPQIQAQLDQVGTHLSDASESMKIQLLDVSEKLLSGSSEMRVALEEGAEHFRDSVTVTQQSFNELSHVIKSTSEELTMTLKDSSEQFTESAKDVLVEMKEGVSVIQQEVGHSVTELHTQLGNIQVEIADHSKEMMADMKEQSKTLQQELGESVLQLQANIAQIQNQIGIHAQEMAHEIQNSVMALQQEVNHSVEELQSRLTIMAEGISDHSDKVLNEMVSNVSTLQVTAGEAIQTLNEDLINVQSKIVSQSETLFTNIESSTMSLQDQVSQSALQLQEKMIEGNSAVIGHIEGMLSIAQQGIATLQEVMESSITHLQTEAERSYTHLTDEAEQMLESIKEGSTAMQQDIGHSVKSVSTQSSEMMTTFTKNLADTYQEFERNCQSLVSHSELKAEELAKSFNQQLVQSQDTQNEMLNDSIKRTGEIINKELENLEKATAREIQTAMQEMGDSLVKITTRFVNDYEKMVLAMDKVIQNNPTF